MNTIRVSIKVALLIITGIIVGIATIDQARADDEPAELHGTIVSPLYEEVFNSGKLGRADDIIAEQYIDHDPLVSGLKLGLAGFKQVVTIFRSAFPDLRFTIEEIIQSKDRVVVRTTLNGTHKGEFMGVVPTGKRVQVTGLDLYRIADGKVVERWGSLNGIALLQQLGILHPAAWQHTLLNSGATDQNASGPQATKESSEKNENETIHEGNKPSEQREATTQITDLVHLDQFKHLFQRDDGEVRVIALLSPN